MSVNNFSPTIHPVVPKYFNNHPQETRGARPWFKKSPDIKCDTFSPEDKTFSLQGRQFFLTEHVSDSKAAHRFYQFRDMENLILKTPSPLTISRARSKTPLEKDVESYDWFDTHGSTLGLTLPECYIRPDTFTDGHNFENGGFWLLENTTQPISTEGWKYTVARGEPALSSFSKQDLIVLRCAKRILNLSATEQKEVIANFSPKSLSLNAVGEITFPYFGMPSCDEDEFFEKLSESLYAWSEGNGTVFQWLTEDFSQEVNEGLRFFR